MSRPGLPIGSLYAPSMSLAPRPGGSASGRTTADPPPRISRHRAGVATLAAQTPGLALAPAGAAAATEAAGTSVVAAIRPTATAERIDIGICLPRLRAPAKDTAGGRTDRKSVV